MPYRQAAPGEDRPAPDVSCRNHARVPPYTLRFADAKLTKGNAAGWIPRQASSDGGPNALCPSHPKASRAAMVREMRLPGQEDLSLKHDEGTIACTGNGDGAYRRWNW